MAQSLEILSPHLQHAAQIKVDNASSVITYVGLSKDPAALSNEAKWSIWRISQTGNVITAQNATDLDFDEIWDNRETYFTGLSLTNQYSTYFDGVNDYVDFGNTFNYDHSNQWSFSVWLKPDNVSTQRTIYSKTTNDANVYGWHIFHNSSGYLNIQARASGYLFLHTSATLQLTAGVWNHVVFTHSGNSNSNGFKLYLNGVAGSTPASGAYSSSLLSGQNAILGRRNTAFEYVGYMDEFTVWNKQLSAGEVTTLYNLGVPNDPSAQSFAGDLVTYCKMGDGDAYPLILDHAGSNNGTMTNMSSSNFQLVVP